MIEEQVYYPAPIAIRNWEKVIEPEDQVVKSENDYSSSEPWPQDHSARKYQIHERPGDGNSKIL
jgi:hypothetical protein